MTKSSRFVWPRKTVRSTMPALKPLIASTTEASFCPVVVLPLICVITSDLRKPALSAGGPATTPSTIGKPVAGSMPKIAPTPPVIWFLANLTGLAASACMAFLSVSDPGRPPDPERPVRRAKRAIAAMPATQHTRVTISRFRSARLGGIRLCCVTYERYFQSLRPTDSNARHGQSNFN